MTPVDTLGEPVTVVDTLGEPVVLINNDGTPAFLAYSAKTYLGGVAPYHYADYITNRMLYAGADVGTVAGGTGYSFTRASDGYYTNSDGTLTLFGSGALRRGDRGVLIEGSRTNLILRSQEFDNASWTKSGATVTANAASAPDGTTTADTLIEDGTTAPHYASATVTTTAAAHTLSVYAKPAGRSWVYIRIADSGNIARVVWFDVTNGVVGATGGGITASIQSAGNGWYRCVATIGTAFAGAQNPRIGVASADSVETYAGNGTSGIFLWGAQLEASSFASSYIPTVAAAATRAADVLTYTVNTTAQINAAVAGQPELVSNPGGPFTSTTGWTGVNGTLSVSSGSLRATQNTGSFVLSRFSLSGLTVGRAYVVTIDFVSAANCSNTQIWVGTALAAQDLNLSRSTTAAGVVTAVFIAGATTRQLEIVGNAASSNGVLDIGSVAVREVPANSLTLYPLQLWSEFERAVDTGGVEVMVRASFDNNNLADVGVNGSDLAELQMVAGGTSQGFPSVAGAVALNTVTKIAGRFNTNSMQLARGGTLGTEDTTATLPTNPTTLFIGAGNATRHSFGYIRRIAIIQGAGTDANLQAMTS
jgi:hypothetical protein